MPSRNVWPSFRERDSFFERISRLIERLSDGTRDDQARDALLFEVLMWQAKVVKPFGRLVKTSMADQTDKPLVPDALPALPTDVFRYTRVASHPAQQDVCVFKTSGTTQKTRGSHPFFDLSLYDKAAWSAAKYALFPDRVSMRLLILAPSFEQAPDSSLSYMLSRFLVWFGKQDSEYIWQKDKLDFDRLQRALREAMIRDEPVALLGTSLAFVHTERALGNLCWRLPPGSRIMQTGGFKGRVREVDSNELRKTLCDRFGISEPWIIQEYGMTELSSQMYESTLRDALQRKSIGPRRFWAPSWVRWIAVDPESLKPASKNTIGLLRIDDLANIDSVCAIQTSDLAKPVSDGFVLLGRAAKSEARGCSIAVDEALER